MLSLFKSMYWKKVNSNSLFWEEYQKWYSFFLLNLPASLKKFHNQDLFYFFYVCNFLILKHPRRFPRVILRLPEKIENRNCCGESWRSTFLCSLDTMKYTGGLQSADNESANGVHPHSVLIRRKTYNSAENNVSAW